MRLATKRTHKARSSPTLPVSSFRLLSSCRWKPEDEKKTISSEEDVRSAGGGGEEEIRDAMMLKKMPKAISSHATITTSCYVGATGNDSRNIDRQRLPCCKIITMQDHYCGNVAKLFYGVVIPIRTLT